MPEHHDEQCVCHGDDRPHAPHRPCDMGCQPDWHRDGCAIYVRIRPDMPHTTATDDGATT